uniref:Uncharacterized protein n=1 Tax=Chromera velia CCMP2878 TaxID=1169474 RepID=A0A0G4FP23_9ALVE|eukprot:Cvel_17854.t1-p1 / transcript=Cvel_17854.t1 / gene=Cvel_17854 / organism=Chromera_velia_CCMP2878 / gene_product=hypothetical protein / transcript_product=hypothetical protein / location=Cvel_scaffold1448:818-2752(-) / protein_length=645 / sequence_SO=supercontig / SO=protein_coding / is_pseudo=false
MSTWPLLRITPWPVRWPIPTASTGTQNQPQFFFGPQPQFRLPPIATTGLPPAPHSWNPNEFPATNLHQSPYWQVPHSRPLRTATQLTHRALPFSVPEGPPPAHAPGHIPAPYASFPVASLLSRARTSSFNAVQPFVPRPTAPSWIGTPAARPSHLIHSQVTAGLSVATHNPIQNQPPSVQASPPASVAPHNPIQNQPPSVQASPPSSVAPHNPIQNQPQSVQASSVQASPPASVAPHNPIQNQPQSVQASSVQASPPASVAPHNPIQNQPQSVQASPSAPSVENGPDTNLGVARKLARYVVVPILSCLGLTLLGTALNSPEFKAVKARQLEAQRVRPYAEQLVESRIEAVREERTAFHRGEHDEGDTESLVSWQSLSLHPSERASFCSNDSGPFHGPASETATHAPPRRDVGAKLKEKQRRVESTVRQIVDLVPRQEYRKRVEWSEAWAGPVRRWWNKYVSRRWRLVRLRDGSRLWLLGRHRDDELETLAELTWEEFWGGDEFLVQRSPSVQFGPAWTDLNLGSALMFKLINRNATWAQTYAVMFPRLQYAHGRDLGELPPSVLQCQTIEEAEETLKAQDPSWTIRTHEEDRTRLYDLYRDHDTQNPDVRGRLLPYQRFCLQRFLANRRRRQASSGARPPGAFRR